MTDVNVSQIARRLGGPRAKMTSQPIRLPGAFEYLSDEDRVLVVAKHSTKVSSAQLALAYGLAVAGGREIWLVLPEAAVWPSLRRAIWLSPKFRVWGIDTRGALTDEYQLPSHSAELNRFREAIRVGVAGLGERADWVAPLLEWARAAPAIQETSRESYVDFKCQGRSVLQITPVGEVLDVRAGTDWSVLPKGATAPETERLLGPISDADAHRLISAASRSAHDRLIGVDGGHAENRLQANLRPEDLQLTDWRREIQAVRPSAEPAKKLGGGRGSLDFLGFEKSTLHVVETKIGPDAMLILQGLDYWSWAMGQRDRLAVVFALPTTTPKVVIDFVVAPDDKGALVGPYTAAQATAFSKEVGWRFHTVSLDGGKPVVTSLPPRTVPPVKL